MPGWPAYAALLAWPLVAVVHFRILPRPNAVIWTVLGGYLALPVAVSYDLPILPAMDKSTLPALSALALCLLTTIRTSGTWLPRGTLARGLLAIFLVVPLITALQNPSPVDAGGVALPGMTLYDGASLALEHLMLAIPFLLGLRFFASPQTHRTLVAAMAVGGIMYSLPILIELRLSPQLHNWVYGFFPHSFAQQIRQGGYRPVVFLGHGLLVATFVAAALVAASAMWRSSNGPWRQRWAAAAALLAALLVLCKSLGALALGALGAVVVALGGRRLARLAMLGVVAMTIAYPALRTSNVLPVSAIVTTVEQVRPERAQSLRFRLDNETILLARAQARPAFGWGGWNRNRVYDSRARDISVTDGRWIIVLGQFGWVGYLAEFGLLCLGLLLLCGPHGRSLPFATGAVGVLLAMNLLDMLPNASMSPLTWLMAGAMLGAAEARYRARAPTSDTPSSRGEMIMRAPATLR
ncbi:MAG: hypothetical protein AAGH68_00930 [Pseudomonadota bacterium]